MCALQTDTYASHVPTDPQWLLLLLVPVLSETLLTLVRGDLVSFSFSTARHNSSVYFLKSIFVTINHMTFRILRITNLAVSLSYEAMYSPFIRGYFKSLLKPGDRFIGLTGIQSKLC